MAVIERWHASLFEPGRFSLAKDTLKPEMMATHDLAYMARLVLSRQWRKLDDTDRARFVDAFTELAVASYATRFVDINGLKARVTDARMTDRGNVEVRARLSLDDEPDVELTYLLRDVAGVLKIINVLADGVSELAIQRGEYRAVMAARGFEGLLTHLRERREGLLNAP